MKQEAPVIYVWFAENKGTERDGEQFIRAWTHDPARVDGLRNAIGKEPTIYAAIEQAVRTAPAARNAGLTHKQRVAIHWAIDTCEQVAQGRYDGTHLTWEYEQELRALLAAPEALPEAAPVAIGYVTQDDLNRLLSGDGAIVSPTSAVATIPVFTAPASEPIARDVLTLMQDLTELASEVNDHTPDSFNKGVMRLSNRARVILEAARDAAILQAATRDEPDFDAAEATVILEDDQILAIEKMVADQIFKEGTQSRKNLTLRTVRTCINVASKPVATRDEPSALTTEVLETLDMFMSLYRAKGWEGDAAYERAEALIAARTPKESK